MTRLHALPDLRRLPVAGCPLLTSTVVVSSSAVSPHMSHMFGCASPCSKHAAHAWLDARPSPRSAVSSPSPRRRMSQGQMSQMARHLNAEHAQGVPSRLMQPPGGRPPSQPRVPIHLMMPHSTNTNMPGSGGSGASSRQPTPHASASDSGLQTRARAAPTHVVPRYAQP